MQVSQQLQKEKHEKCTRRSGRSTNCRMTFRKYSKLSASSALLPSFAAPPPVESPFVEGAFEVSDPVGERGSVEEETE